MNTLLVDRRWTRYAAIATLFAVSVYAAQTPLKVGDPFPDLAAQQLEGKLPDSLKGKVVLVDFWASWCVPCAKSFPLMEELHNKYKDRGLVIVAVSVDEKAADMTKFLKKQPVTFTVVRDAAQKLVSIAEVEAMPTSFLLDGEGKVRFIHKGFHGEETRKQYLAEIESLLKGTP
jgi:thiol-disulfide isomerase/thioredoxin